MEHKNPAKVDYTKVPRIPAPILQFYKDIQLYMDFFFVKFHPFSTHQVQRSCQLPVSYTTTKQAKVDQRARPLKKGFNKFWTRIVKGVQCKLYVIMYGGWLEGSNLQICGANEHLGLLIEMSIRTIKDERARCAVAFKRHTKRMTNKSLIKEVVSLLNDVPSKDGVQPQQRHLEKSNLRDYAWMKNKSTNFRCRFFGAKETCSRDTSNLCWYLFLRLYFSHCITP